MADPQTIIRDGSGAQSASYQLPPGLFQYVESVLVQVDNTAGGDIRPTLSVATVNGVVMATKRQGESIPAGDTGTATWALRLADEPAAAGPVPVTGQVGLYTDAVRAIAPANNDTSFVFAYSSGAALLDLTFPGFARFAAAGVYVCTAYVFANAAFVGTGKVGTVKMFPAGPGQILGNAWSTLPLDHITVSGAHVTVPRVASAGDFLQVTMMQDAVASASFGCYLNVVKIG